MWTVCKGRVCQNIHAIRTKGLANLLTVKEPHALMLCHLTCGTWNFLWFFQNILFQLFNNPTKDLWQTLSFSFRRLGNMLRDASQPSQGHRVEEQTPSKKWSYDDSSDLPRLKTQQTLGYWYKALTGPNES